MKNIFAALEVKKEICFMFVRSTGYVIFSASVVNASKKLEFQLAFWRRSSQIVQKEICFMFVRSTGYVIFSASVVSASKKLEFQLAFWRRSSQIVLALGKSSFMFLFMYFNFGTQLVWTPPMGK